MRILLVNVPHPAIGSRIPREQLPPFGLLCVGGPLIDAGHEVRLVDGEFGPMSHAQIVAQAVAFAPDAVLFGHSGSSSGHPVVAAVSRAVRRALPDAKILYGGVHPTYHWREILREEPQVDVIVRGEGEETGRRLVEALAAGAPIDDIPGLAFRVDGKPHATPPAPVIRDLDAYRIGWELIDHARYSYWGGKRAVVIQFSRGCPHLCNYCGQRGFWTRWRHRDPHKLAAEIAHLHREHGVEVFNFADENPSAGRKPWLEFLQALVDQDIEVTLVGSTRADDIVRDADHLHLYKKAGFERFLLGMENTDEATLKLIKKGGATATDREAVKLLRKHGILSMATWVAGFEDQTDADLLRGLRQLISYDPDQIQALYVTPHRWTPYYRLAEDRRVVQPDQTKWDYKHQVLAMKRMPPWRVFLLVKLVEACAQLRPRALWRVVSHPDPKIRHAMRWYYRMGRRVWIHEIVSFFFRDRHLRNGPLLTEFWGAAQDHEEEASAVRPAPAPRPRALVSTG
ncbi:magnesium-protoporphyrin IX monomethyl ester anaerobic oxidative cyclase [Caulobacter sp. 17J65-9]|uniref:magnesium-protoporphyrin IX monomethyl ester anaerobic oxidative cyclase n=1 Tax=Caulobacter sp. 17J65-9 TaxID=2709382 RepID=UPI0013C743B5|nr:magnesium-protoporphyrin IX monomethyl ester anaerobic oxidative cyclase [Caulobacter sp. 17J65-9]